ncbi:MAG: FeoB small GTPase domain-containing protein [Candidatus Zixiibacteriota bacterium]
MKVLLLGNPNVGKSVVFNRLSDTFVVSSNYPGATVEFAQGKMLLGDQTVQIIDSPGTYTLNPDSPAEKVAVKMLDDLEEGDICVNVIETTNIERNLNLTLQLLKRKIPTVIVLNMWDEAKHTGVSVDVEKLEKILGVPCIPVVALTGEGIKNLVEAMEDPGISDLQVERDNIWAKIGEIIEETVELKHKHHTFWERMADLTIHPASGLPIAAVVLFLAFVIIRFIGEGLIGYILEPIFEKLWKPVLMWFSGLLGSGGLIHNILVGKLIGGELDFVESLGLLSTGLFVPIGMVLPYIFAFYLVLSFLEDSGYLPRLGVLLDTFMHRIGLHGLSIIPMMLSAGCNVPGVLGTRLLETRRERLIAITLMSISIPCMAQIAVILSLVGNKSIGALVWVFGTLFVVWIVIGIILNKTVKGISNEIFVEIPPYRLPYITGLFKKLWMRLVSFFTEAVPWVMAGVLIVNLLYALGIVGFLGRISRPVIQNLMGLPGDAVAAMIIGLFRKDVAVGMLAPLALSTKQLVVASVALSMYFPCIATFAVIVKELGIADMLKSAAIMIASTLIVATILNLLPAAWF